ncbi:hypothetical protein ASPCADRAFT_134319 [Aspergillus carbonarius ITEM 5010]|uniref:Secreted protein n=1 Tax=Aspergillus carbonarius (strain ITEM 5010) TaxID=602072 RepID=A0A1R3RA06_ASPC5|nr:hypothetical protein ASPCADRAFT_134319 [Aspergillus carbonarius ITEM 5010]
MLTGRLALIPLSPCLSLFVFSGLCSACMLCTTPSGLMPIPRVSQICTTFRMSTAFVSLYSFGSSFPDAEWYGGGMDALVDQGWNSLSRAGGCRSTDSPWLTSILQSSCSICRIVGLYWLDSVLRQRARLTAQLCTCVCFL